jgi:hypothetical protein
VEVLDFCVSARTNDTIPSFNKFQPLILANLAIPILPGTGERYRTGLWTKEKEVLTTRKRAVEDVARRCKGKTRRRKSFDRAEGSLLLRRVTAFIYSTQTSMA